MKLSHMPHYTYEDYAKWQGDWELIEGIPYSMASPKFAHQWVIFELSALIREALKRANCPCLVVGELDWIVSEDTVFRPDLVILCEKPTDYIRHRPELVLEVVSESSKLQDEVIKFEKYEELGVPYYILIYPEQKSWKAYKNTKYGFKAIENLRLRLKDCEVEIDINTLWSLA